jgi:predicted ribosome quality control (RQC) complex YloA/Tae2 family protein
VQKTLTSFELAALISELKERLEGARLKNIYQIEEGILILKFHKANEPSESLLIEPGKRLHLSSYLWKVPKRPPAFCMALRKHLRNSRVLGIGQHEFERIITIEASTKEGNFTLVSEIFGEGNVILVDSTGVIKHALTYRKMRDRNIVRGEAFQHAPSSGIAPLLVKNEDLAGIKDFKNLEVVRALTKLLSISGKYAEEILLRAQVNKNKRCESLSTADLDRIHNALEETLSQLKAGQLQPCAVLDTAGKWIDVIPVHLKKYEGFKLQRFETFNKALDEFYAKVSVEQETLAAAAKVHQEILRQQRILQEQIATLEEEKLKAQTNRKIGDQIYAHFHHLKTLFHRLAGPKKGGQMLEGIAAEIEEEGRKGIEPSTYFKSLDVQKRTLKVSIGELSFSLQTRRSVQDNAKGYYDKAKKAAKKSEGAREAIRKTLNNIEKLKQAEEISLRKEDKSIRKKRRKAWYEKFKWFYTSENLLVVGGKDAITNEILVKRHTAPQDLVFHADISGAPFVLIKAEERKPSQKSIQQAAQLAAAYSKAWKAKFSAVDVFYVRPEQVSKKAPSGEHLQRGAFMIRGKKDYVRKVPLRLAIGFDATSTHSLIIGGPREALEKRTRILVEIVPGDLSSRKLTDEIREILMQKAPTNLQGTIAKMPNQDIQTLIPFGKGAIPKKGKR